MIGAETSPHHLPSIKEGGSSGSNFLLSTWGGSDSHDSWSRSVGENSVAWPHPTAEESAEHMSVSVPKEEGKMSLGDNQQSAQVTDTRIWSYYTSFYSLLLEGSPVGRMIN